MNIPATRAAECLPGSDGLLPSERQPKAKAEEHGIIKNKLKKKINEKQQNV